MQIQDFLRYFKTRNMPLRNVKDNICQISEFLKIFSDEKFQILDFSDWSAIQGWIEF